MELVALLIFMGGLGDDTIFGLSGNFFIDGDLGDDTITIVSSHGNNVVMI